MVKPTRWLEIILLYTALTAVIVYLIPGDSVLFPIRYVFGFVFVLFMPGYCLVNILFLGKDRIDPVETLVLSVALSFGITGLVLLFFGLSPIGINFTSTTVSLIVVVLVLAAIAFVRKRKAPETVQTAPAEQVP
jgi:uncharacterized membrane protein